MQRQSTGRIALSRRSSVPRHYISFRFASHAKQTRRKVVHPGSRELQEMAHLRANVEQGSKKAGGVCENQDSLCNAPYHA